MEVPHDRFDNIYKENFQFIDSRAYIVCSMFTPNRPELFQQADRLAKSCEKCELPYSLYIVPEIHKSLAMAGKDDLSFTRTNLISHNLTRFPDKSTLCLDVDMFFMDYPEKFDELSDLNYDFAVYNWLNDMHNEAYVPVNGRLETGDRYSDFYAFSHFIGFFSHEQLISSGGVQFYRNSDEARYLLESWQAFIASNPDSAEDQCLDFVYNNFILNRRNLKAFWLDKSYLRFPWWPHVKPVIIHPGLPGGGTRKLLTEVNGRKRFYMERCQPKSLDDLIFPRDCIVDTKEKVLLKIVNNRIVDRRPIQQEFWIYPEKVGLE
jgi:hypothetical protein